MNAIIKERISPDGMTMTETSHHVELQYHGKILSVHVERKAPWKDMCSVGMLFIAVVMYLNR